VSVNKAILIGNLGKDPETITTASGVSVCKFSLATTEKVKDEKKTEWHRITAWGKLADICGQYLTKGKLVYIEGRIQTREWEDKEGVKRQTTEIVANEMRMLGSKQEGQAPDKPRKPEPNVHYGKAGEPVPPMDDDDMPF